MRRFLVMLAAVALLVSGCSKKEGGAEEQAAAGSGSAADMMPGKDVTATSGTEAAPGTDVPQEPIAGVTINAFFDEAGTQTEIAVKPGEQFKVYVMATTIDPYETSSAQLRLQLPPGLTILYQVESDKKLSSMGKIDFNYIVVYACTPPSRFNVVSYVCQAEPDFKGGSIEVLPGFNSDNSTLLGFITCEFVELHASGNAVTVKLKT